PAFVLRRRQIWWDKEKQLRQNVLFEDYTEVAPQISLPRSIVCEIYGAPWDEAKLRNNVCSRQHLRVSKILVEAIPDSRFRADIPRGAHVDDLVSPGAGNRA